MAALVVVYLVWGSTYLAIKAAVRGDDALPPLLLGAYRMGLASTILFAIAALRGESLKLGFRGLSRAAASGTLLWFGGNGLLIIGLTRIDSGLAAVLMATTPMWLALVTTIRDRRAPTRRALLGLSLGLAGVGLLVASTQTGAVAVSAVGVILVLAAALSWALGSTLPRPGPSPLVSAAAIMWFASVGFAIASTVFGEPLALPSARVLVALAYLAVVGSAVGFVAYLVATERLALPMVMTHAQVNPLVAVLLGALVAGESISGLTIIAAALIVSSIPLSR